MDIMSLVARIKSIRFSKKPVVAVGAEEPAVAAAVKRPAVAADAKKRALAAGVLAVAVVGGVLYFFVYQLEEPSPTPAAAPPVARKPLPAPAQPAAKPVTPQPAAPAPSMAASQQQPVVAQVPSAPVPSPEIIAGAAMPDPVAQKPAKKRKVAAKAKKRVAKPEQAVKLEPVDKLDSSPDAQDTNTQVAPQPQDVLLKPAHTPAEPVTPAPAEPSPASPAEPAPGAPAQQRGVIAPKYNDIVTAVLRGDREAAKELLDLGWWVDKPSESGVTPLIAAVMNRDTEMVQMLLEYGAEPTSQALKLAHKNKDEATVSLLEQKGAR